MLLPLIILALAGVASAVVAYGTHPHWAAYRHGVGVILFSRQYQWPIGALAILMCLVLIVLVVSGKRRAWWLVGLGPVLALFCHRFYSNPLSGFAVLDGPVFVAADKAKFLGDNDWVAGVVFNGSAYAYPFYCLYPAPVLFQADHEKRMVLMWSAFANRGVAYTVNRELYPRDLEIVTMPANALLLYNSRLGQFINGLTGLTPRSQKPTGFSQPLTVEKMTYRQWRAAHPATRVMAPPGGGDQRLPNIPPQSPYFAMPAVAGPVAPGARIILIATTQPMAVAADAIGDRPMNVNAGSLPLLVFKDPLTGRVRMFDRRITGPPSRFKLNTSIRRKGVYLVDQESNSGWSADGRVIDGPLARDSRHLVAVPIDEWLYWGVMKHWMPDLQWLTLTEIK